MNVSLTQIRSDKNMKEPEGCLDVLVTILLAVVMVYFARMYRGNTAFLLAELILLIAAKYFARRFYPDWPRKKDEVGVVNFSEAELEFMKGDVKMKIAYSEIEEFKLHYNHVRGRSWAPRDIIHNGIAEIVMRMNDNRVERFKVVFKKMKEQKEFKNVLKCIYKSGIAVLERMGNYEVKTILFDGNLKYDRIQQLKKELGNEDIFK